MTLTAQPGRPGVNGGNYGMGIVGVAGVAGPAGSGIGGGLFLDPAGSAARSNTTVSGNAAPTGDNDVHGTFKSAG
jgi:hypothetical protein